MKLLLAALAASFVAPRADTLAFSVKQGTKLEKTIELSLQLDSKHVSISIAGKDLPEDVLSKFEMSVSNTIELGVEDEYSAVEAGRPTGIVRHFKTAKSHQKAHELMPGGKPTDRDEPLDSPLADHAVAFHWNAKDESWERAFEGSEGDKACLEPLKAEMDFLALLHPGKLEEGASWKIDAQKIGELVKPGGDLSFPRKQGSNARFEIDKHPKGTLEASFTGTREDHGHKYGVIQLEGEIKTSQEADPSAKLPLGLEGTLELKGEYLWDLERGCLHSYEIGGSVSLTASGEREIESQGEKATMRIQIELGGELKAKGTIE